LKVWLLLLINEVRFENKFVTESVLLGVGVYTGARAHTTYDLWDPGVHWDPIAQLDSNPLLVAESVCHAICHRLLLDLVPGVEGLAATLSKRVGLIQEDVGVRDHLDSFLLRELFLFGSNIREPSLPYILVDLPIVPLE